jgi:alpha-tubulin suppressor-like RCC1 family protein
VAGISNALSVTVNAVTFGGLACALLSSGAIACWGSNGDGDLGDGTQTLRLTPVDVQGLGGTPTSVSTGGQFTCATLASGAAQCWGSANSGQIGDGNATGPDLCPNAINGCALTPQNVLF